MRMNLTTFLRNDSLDSVQRTTKLSISSLEGTSGGDYYWPAKNAVEKIFIEEAPYDLAAGDVLKNLSKDYQRLDNDDAIRAMHKWKLNHPGEFLVSPSGEFSGPKNELIISLKPSFALKRNGNTTAYVLWFFKEERLTATIAGMGIHLMELILQHGDHASWRFGMIDVKTGKAFTRTHKNTAYAALEAVRAQEELIISCKALSA